MDYYVFLFAHRWMNLVNSAATAKNNKTTTTKKQVLFRVHNVNENIAVITLFAHLYASRES